MYKNYEEKYQEKAFCYISQMLKEIKGIHKISFENSPKARRALELGITPDHEQSWRAFKGKNLEKLIKYILVSQIEKIGLKIISGNSLERVQKQNEELAKVKRNLLVDFGEFGCHLPDVDLVIYQPTDYKVVAVLSIKVTLRERIAQTGYWKIKLANDKITEHIKVFFITLDEDNTLEQQFPCKKGRAITEIDTDGSYVLTDKNLQESKKVKTFDKFLHDLKSLI
ncbi:MAG: BsaWI family type II restriction enzyme [Bacteroidia bacterium]|nr:BsaWI family type II restriction enzyme [Bacteroidia bacterium]